MRRTIPIATLALVMAAGVAGIIIAHVGRDGLTSATADPRDPSTIPAARTSPPRSAPSSGVTPAKNTSPAAAAGGAPSSNPAQRSAATPSPEVVAVVVSVAGSCVQPGGTQTVTVASRPGLQVTVNLRYSDGNNGASYGGLAVAQTIGPDGTYRETFTVSASAPDGPVTVYAGVASTSGPREDGAGTATFSVAGHC